MSAWKVLVIGLLASVCFVFAMSTLLAPMVHNGNQRWVWMGGSLVATVCAIGVFSMFLRYASNSLNAKPSRGRS